MNKIIIIFITGLFLLTSCEKENKDSSTNQEMLYGKYTVFEGGMLDENHNTLFEGEMLHEKISFAIEIDGDRVKGQVTAQLLNLQNTDFEGTVEKVVNHYGSFKWYNLVFKAENSEFSFDIDIDDLELNTAILYEGEIYKNDEYVGGFYTIPEGVDTLEVIDYQKTPIKPCRHIDKINGNYFVLHSYDSLTIYDETWKLKSKQKLRTYYNYIQITHDDDNIFLVSQSCIYRYNLDLELQDSILVDGMVGTCAVYENSLWIQKLANGEILNISFDGTLISSFDSQISYPSPAIIENGYLYITDQQYPRGTIKKMSLSGELVASYCTFEVNWSPEGYLAQLDGEIWYICLRGLMYQVKL